MYGSNHLKREPVQVAPCGIHNRDEVALVSWHGFVHLVPNIVPPKFAEKGHPKSKRCANNGPQQRMLSPVGITLNLPCIAKLEAHTWVEDTEGTGWPKPRKQPCSLTHWLLQQNTKPSRCLDWNNRSNFCGTFSLHLAVPLLGEAHFETSWNRWTARRVETLQQWQKQFRINVTYHLTHRKKLWTALQREWMVWMSFLHPPVEKIWLKTNLPESMLLTGLLQHLKEKEFFTEKRNTRSWPSTFLSGDTQDGSPSWCTRVVSPALCGWVWETSSSVLLSALWRSRWLASGLELNLLDSWKKQEKVFTANSLSCNWLRVKWEHCATDNHLGRHSWTRTSRAFIIQSGCHIIFPANTCTSTKPVERKDETGVPTSLAAPPLPSCKNFQKSAAIYTSQSTKSHGVALPVSIIMKKATNEERESRKRHLKFLSVSFFLLLWAARRFRFVWRSHFAFAQGELLRFTTLNILDLLSKKFPLFKRTFQTHMPMWRFSRRQLDIDRKSWKIPTCICLPK